MSRPIVTIVTGAYHTNPKHLAMAIESALGQTWRHLELIVSDDSTDASLRSVVERFDDPRVRYRRNSPSLGVARNHWVCLRESRGEYIAILNHDDCFAPEFVERLVTPLEDYPDVALAFCDHWIIDTDGNLLADETERCSAAWGRDELSEGVHQPFFGLLASQTIPMAMGTLFRRRLLPEALPDQAGPAYDLWLTYLLCRDGLGAYYVRDRLSYWRAHSQNLTSQRNIDWSSGAAECWHRICNDRRFSSVRRVARKKAAQAYYSCCIANYFEGRRTRCFTFGLRSVLALPTWRGFAACCLPVIPRALSRRLIRERDRRPRER